MAAKGSVLVLDRWYQILTCPHRLKDDAGRPWRCQVDHGERVIWIDAGVTGADRQGLVERAIDRVLAERMKAVQVVS